MGSHVYSTSATAARKRILDFQITGGDVAKQGKIDMNSDDYLKQLIKLSSKGKIEVSDKANKLQFFIIRGGAEGFLDSWLEARDANNVVDGEANNTSGDGGITMRFSYTDLLAVFDTQGKLLSSAKLERPVWIKTPKKPHFWREETANNVYSSWDGAPVSIYHNTNPKWPVHYYGLWMNDRQGYYSSGHVRVDLHKQEATNGCIFIVDDNTPDYDDKHPAALSHFEPQLIKDVQKAIGAKVKSNIGIMHMVDIQ